MSGESKPIPMSAYTLGSIAYNAWCEAARQGETTEFYADLEESERAIWKHVGTKVAERVRKALEGD